MRSKIVACSGEFWQWWGGRSIRDRLFTAVGTMAITWYFVAILVVGLTEIGKQGDANYASLRQFMSVSITMISGTLATYLGLILGLSQVRETQKQPVNQLPGITTPQAVAAWSYVASLVLALLIWSLSKTPPDQVIESLGRSILGLFGGVLIVILNTEKSRTPTTPDELEPRSKV